MVPIFHAIQKAGPPTELVFEFSYLDMVSSFREAVWALGLSIFVPYQLRHSGRSWDKLHQRRSQVAIMRRGRWRSLASLARYEKGGMLMKEYANLSETLRLHIEQCAIKISRVILGDSLPLRR